MTATRILPDGGAELRLIVERMDGSTGSAAVAALPGSGIRAVADRVRILAAIFAPLLDRHPAATQRIAADPESHPAAAITCQGHDTVLADDECWWLKVYMHHERLAHPAVEADASSPRWEGDGSSQAALAANVETLHMEIAQRETIRIAAA